MSAKKDFETKIPEEENTDSGFLSGPLTLHSEELSAEDSQKDLDPSVDSDSKKVISDSSLDQELDSGIILSECLSKVKISDTQPAPSTQLPPTITVGDDKTSQDIPPLAILFQQDDDGDTQLHISAVHGCEKSVRTLIRVCPDRAWLDIPNDFGHTALHLAVLSGKDVVARMLVQAGASLGARDLAGDTPIHMATAAKNKLCLHALLYMPENVQRMRSCLNQKNYNGQTSVHIAAEAGDVETLRVLVYYGADINAKEGLCGWSALHVAARRGDEPLARFLLEQCPAVAVSARDYAHRTPRRLARRQRSLRALLDAARRADSDTDYSDTDDEFDLDDSETESLFEKIRESLNPINVA